MTKAKDIFLGIFVILLLVLILNPSLVGTTASATTFGGTFSNVWFGLGTIGQTMVLALIVIVTISFAITKGK